MSKIGDFICCGVNRKLTEIKNIIPAKWDGMKECFEVSSPTDATDYIVEAQDGEYIAVSVDCVNKEMLIDII